MNLIGQQMHQNARFQGIQILFCFFDFYYHISKQGVIPS